MVAFTEVQEQYDKEGDEDNEEVSQGPLDDIDDRVAREVTRDAGHRTILLGVVAVDS